jgi:hypothetical protein
MNVVLVHWSQIKLFLNLSRAKPFFDLTNAMRNVYETGWRDGLNHS